MKNSSQMWGSWNILKTSRHENTSLRSSLLMAPSSRSRSMMYSFSSCLSSLQFIGELGMKKDEKIPKRTVKIPSRMKIQAQPGLPPIPDISEIPAARRPLNAPAKDEAAKTTDKLCRGVSRRLVNSYVRLTVFGVVLVGRTRKDTAQCREGHPLKRHSAQSFVGQ